jgi:hypothetical protein
VGDWVQVSVEEGVVEEEAVGLFVAVQVSVKDQVGVAVLVEKGVSVWVEVSVGE